MRRKTAPGSKEMFREFGRNDSFNNGFVYVKEVLELGMAVSVSNFSCSGHGDGEDHSSRSGGQKVSEILSQQTEPDMVAGTCHLSCAGSVDSKS
jgi:hypothetical protein